MTDKLPEPAPMLGITWDMVDGAVEAMDALRIENERLQLLLTNNQQRREEVEDRHGELLRANERLRAVVDAAEALRQSAATINQPPWLP